MTGKQISVGLAFVVCLLAGCAGKQTPDPAFRIVLTDLPVYEKQQFSEQELSGYAGQVELLEGNEAAAVDMLRKGEADCGYGIVDPDNAIHYGILKSQVVKSREMLLVSEKRILNTEDMKGLVVGYPDDLNEEFVGYLNTIEDVELHAYLSKDQLKKDLRSGILDLAAAETDPAFQILESNSDSWQISQLSDVPVLEYRYFACTQEALDQAAAFRKEN